MIPKPKPGPLRRFWRAIALNSATVTLLVLLLSTAGLGVTGVFILAGMGWSFVAGSVACLLAALFLRHGMLRK